MPYGHLKTSVGDPLQPAQNVAVLGRMLQPQLLALALHSYVPGIFMQDCTDTIKHVYSMTYKAYQLYTLLAAFPVTL